MDRAGPAWRRRAAALIVVALLGLTGCGEKAPSGSGEERQDSRVHIAEALLREGAVTQALEQLRGLSAEPGEAPSPTHVPAWFSPTVEQLIRLRRLTEADSMLSLLGPAESLSASLRYLAANVAVLSGREREGQRLYESLLEDPDLRGRAAVDLATLHRTRGRQEQALAVARAGLDDDPENQSLRQLEVAALLDLDRPAEALDEAQRLPLSAGRRTLEGDALLAMGEADSALVLLGQALQITPRSIRARYLLGRAYVAVGNGARAAQAIEPLARAVPPYEDAQEVLARAYRLLGRGAAADSLEAVFAVMDRDRRIRELRLQGLLHSRENELEPALDLFSRARDLAPDDPDLHNDLGAVLARMGRYDEAERELRRAEELRPDDAAVQQNLAQLYTLEGDSTRRSLALEKLQRLLASAGTKPDAADTTNAATTSAADSAGTSEGLPPAPHR